MATCPKCGHHLKLTDWRPECPSCGVNMIYFGMEDRLTADADLAETEHAKMQKHIDRLKASFIGSKLTIVRVVLSILPIAALMLPLAKISYSGPFIQQVNESVNAITIYNLVSSLDFGALFNIIGSSVVGTGFIFYAVSLVTLLLSLVLIIVSLVLLVMACGPKGNPRNISLNVITLVFAVVSAVSFVLFSGKTNAVFPDFYSGSLGIGAIVYIVTIAALLAINIIISRVGVNVRYKECFIGGIPSEEYFAMLESGESMESIRAKMNAALAEKEAEAEAERIAEEEKRLQEETERIRAELEKSHNEAHNEK